MAEPRIRKLVICAFAIFSCVFGEIATSQEQDPALNDHRVNVEELIATMKQVNELPGNRAQSLPNDALVMWTDRATLGVRYSEDFQTSDYLTLYVTVWNRTQKVQTIQPGAIQLVAWGQRFGIVDPKSIQHIATVSRGGEEVPIREIQTPDAILIPAGEAVGFWAVFAELQRTPTIGTMQLAIPVQDGATLQVDLREEQKRRLAISSERIGPAEALGVLTIHGQLNSINQQDLLDEVNFLYAKGVRRALVRWGKTASEADDRMLDWILFSASNPGEVKLSYQSMAQLPPLQVLVCASPPEANSDAFTWDASYDKVLFHHERDAAWTALNSLYVVVEPILIEREIREGHPLSRSAALRVMTARNEAPFDKMFPTLKRLLSNASQDDRPDILMAIGQQSDPDAIKLLTDFARHGSEAEANAAFEALLVSRNQASVIEIQELLRVQGVVVPVSKQIELLTEHYRPAWLPFLSSGLENSDAKVRSASLTSLVKVGHPQLAEFLKNALQDSEKSVREIAFQELTTRGQRGDPRSEAVAVEYAVKVLGHGDASQQVLQLIERTRDSRAAPLLVKFIRESSGNHPHLIEMLSSVGDDSHVRELLKIREDLVPRERSALLNVARALDLPEVMELASEAIRSDDPEFRLQGLTTLTLQGSDAAVDMIIEFLAVRTDSELEQGVLSLGQIGTPYSLRALKEFQKQSYIAHDAAGLRFAYAGIYAWYQNSPAWNSIQHAYYQSQVENLENALMYFQIATEIDPEVGVAYHGMGNALLKLKRYRESKEAYQKALELDEFDGYAITGLAIVMAIEGQTSEAVDLALASIDKFPEDNVYYYNTACVYGRAIESLTKKQPTEAIEEIVAEYQKAGIEKLKEALAMGFDELDLMNSDPDIASLRELPEFTDLLKK